MRQHVSHPGVIQVGAIAKTYILLFRVRCVFLSSNRFREPDSRTIEASGGARRDEV